MDRRVFVSVVIGGVPLALAGRWVRAGQSASSARAGASVFEVTRTDAEWRKTLTPTQFSVLRKHDTERPGSSPLNQEHRRGIYHCAGCNLALYASTTKFESGTGWPSFTAALPNAIGTTEDRSLFDVRTEVHCRRCGGHLGHVFDDGPAPTGKRYCMNGAAMTFAPASTAERGARS
jgi:peptide-methionine (R)-S-oxide reductase